MVSSPLVFPKIVLVSQIPQPPTLDQWESLLSQEMQEFDNYFQFVLGFVVLLFLVRGIRGS